MKIAITLMFFAIVSLGIVLFYQQGQMNQLEEEYREEKILFDARFGEIVRLNDEIGEYKDSCYIYRKEIKELSE